MRNVMVIKLFYELVQHNRICFFNLIFIIFLFKITLLIVHGFLEKQVEPKLKEDSCEKGKENPHHQLADLVGDGPNIFRRNVFNNCIHKLNEFKIQINRDYLLKCHLDNLKIFSNSILCLRFKDKKLHSIMDYQRFQVKIKINKPCLLLMLQHIIIQI